MRKRILRREKTKKVSEDFEKRGEGMRLTDYKEVLEIKEGWSHEEGQHFLLRIAPIEQYDQKKAEFENMQMI